MEGRKQSGLRDYDPHVTLHFENSPNSRTVMRCTIFIVVGPVIDLTGSTIDLLCTSPMLIDSSTSSNAEVDPTIDNPDTMLQESASDNSDNAINYESHTHPPTPEMDMRSSFSARLDET